MAQGMDDEFDYLDEHEGIGTSKSREISEDAPIIRGAKKRSVLPSEESSKENANEIEEDEEELEEEALGEVVTPKVPREHKSVIFVVKVTTNKEEKALELIAEKIKKKNIDVYAIARPHGLRGYIFLEAPDRENAEEAVFNLPYVKGIIPKLVSYDEIKSMLEPVTADIKIEKNDIVEMIAEPFKKEKAKVVRIDKAKGEAVVSLLGAAVPIPVTVKLDNVRVIRREDAEESPNKEEYVHTEQQNDQTSEIE